MARAADGSPLLPPASATAARWPFLAPFATRSFRFQWPADLCTAWALEMETLILGWYVLVQTGSVLWLTAFGALQFIGTLASPLLGTLGDRLGLRRVLASMRFAYAALSGVILLLAATGQLSPWAVLAVAGVAGMLRPSDIGMRTALVHESFLRLAGRVNALQFQSRGHFYAYAARVMRSVIVDLVREQAADRRGGGAAHVTLDTVLGDGLADPNGDAEALRVDEALTALATVEPRLAQVVEMRYFAGMTDDEIAQVLGLTDRTVRRDWDKARLLLRSMLA